MKPRFYWRKEVKYLNIKEELKKLRETEMSYPIEYFVNDALQVCEYAKEDGYILEDIIIELKNFNNNTEKLHLVYGKYYDENNRIYIQYASIAGYMQCIGHDINMIDKKLSVK